ncbi:hypothetical protein PVNG_05878 [Plasmodium vivax North Korean]|uniref:PIR Superfamily Protein n=1 Tax=Plasmodium vivax North Korean TaxID=1035514 RepID=A0A0J9TK67_PLAVI|nr:hypothetical protein PVNG_05878 [Plasmodium vivax North Korean]
MDTFLYLESQLNNENEEEPEAGFCNSLDTKSDNDFQLKRTCKSFVKLFKLLKKQCGNECSTDKSKYFEFMNYWLNYKLRSIAKYDYIKTNFYKELQTKYLDSEAHSILYRKIYDIKVDTYKNMYILYKLYKIIDKIKEGTIEYKTGIVEFKTDYNNAFKQCFLETNDNLYNALEQFRKYYEKKVSYIKSCTNGECPTLPQLINKFQ